MRIGYGRVSLLEPETGAERRLLEAAGCDRIVIAPAADPMQRRAELTHAIQLAAADGQLVVTSLSQLGLSPKQLAGLAADLQAAAVDLVVLDRGINTATSDGRRFFAHLAAVAEFLSARKAEQIRTGLAFPGPATSRPAQAEPKARGRKPRFTREQAAQAAEMYIAGERTRQQIADTFGVSQTTIYKSLKRLGVQMRRRLPTAPA